MKIIYQGKEVGLNNNVKKVIDMFGDNIRISPKHIMACRLNNEVKPLDYKIGEGDTVELIDLKDPDGLRVYIRGVLYVMTMAFYNLFSDLDDKLIINYQLKNSMFCEVVGHEITEEMIKKLQNEMQRIVDEDYDIVKKEMTIEEAKEFYKDKKYKRGALQLENPNKETVSLYFCEDFYNYFYGVMPLSTAYVDVFKVEKYKDGFIVRYPSKDDSTVIGEFKETKKLSSTLQEYANIYELMDIETIGDLNKEIREGRIKDVILTSEALHEKKMAEIADKIALKKDKIKMVLIAGPSSSGKTTFAKRLGMQLRINGMNPVTIGTDNYFVERDQTPKDENGEYDFETIDALDLDLFNEHLEKLIKGEKVNIPTFDFKTGSKSFSEDKFLQMKEGDVLVIEGIHCLNDRLTAKVAAENKFKIYISDLTVLNIDPYNRISTTDTRLIRRTVRDHNFRGYSALDTLQRWDSVVRGENKNIFPYQEKADAMYNSSLVYELAVLGKYAKPLFKEIAQSEAEYAEAKRLLSFLEYFEEVDERLIPNNSILKEFIGGSIFEY